MRHASGINDRQRLRLTGRQDTLTLLTLLRPSQGCPSRCCPACMQPSGEAVGASCRHTEPELTRGELADTAFSSAYAGPQHLDHDDGAAIGIQQARHARQQLAPPAVHMRQVRRVVRADLHGATPKHLQA